MAAVYDAAFAGVEGVDPLRRAPAATHVYHQYVVRVEDRDGALESLRRAGVAAGVHYPLALHQQPALAGVVADSGFEHAERLAAHVLSLPIYPELSMSQQERVIEAVSAHAATLLPERAG